MKSEKFNLDEVKELLKNTRWEFEQLTYVFKDDTLQISGKPTDVYDVVEDGDGQFFLNFKGEQLLIEQVDEQSLRINDKGKLVRLIRTA